MPILHSNLETDLRLAVTLEQALMVTLTDTVSLRDVPGLIDDHGDVNGSGSDTHRVRFASLDGADHFVTTAAEDTAVAETALTDTSVDIAVVRAALVRNIGDLATATGFGQDIDAASLARDMVMSYNGYFNGLLATAGATATSNVGTAGADMTHSDFLDAVFTLEIADVPGPWFAVLHARQLADWQESLRAEGGATQYMAATADMIQIKGQGFAGTHSGVSIWRSSDVISAGGDREGFMFGAHAFGYKTASIDSRAMLGAGSSLAVAVDNIYVEITRTAASALTNIAGNAWVGLSVKEQARLVGIVTDA